MTQKNKEKEERKARRKPPIPYARIEAGKRERLEKNFKKYRKPLDKCENI